MEEKQGFNWSRLLWSVLAGLVIGLLTVYILQWSKKSEATGSASATPTCSPSGSPSPGANDITFTFTPDPSLKPDSNQVTIEGWYEGTNWGSFCTMKQDCGSYTCTLTHVPSTANPEFTVRFEKFTASGGFCYTFNKGEDACGGHGKFLGKLEVTVGGKPMELATIWNGFCLPGLFGSDPNTCEHLYFNGRFATPR